MILLDDRTFLFDKQDIKQAVPEYDAQSLIFTNYVD